MKKIIGFILLAIFIISSVVVFNIYQKIYGNNITETAYIHIPSSANFQTVEQLVAPFLKNIDNFNWVAKKKNYPNKIRSGKFKISEGMNNNDLVDHLRGGKPETVKVTFNNQDSFDNLAGRIAVQIEADSISILKSLLDINFIESSDFDSNTALAMYIPNSYEFYWDTSADEFRERMLKEYQSFWNENRLNNAKKQELTPIQVISLASIVQKETALVVERPTVAGLYLNRYHHSWPLQADPTILFILRQIHGQDAEFKRVLLKDLEIESPYNTYKNIGIPPGPIGMPDISSIDAVLQPQVHNYYYMCASIDQIGKHEFATNLSAHLVNARKYQNWMNRQGINR